MNSFRRQSLVKLFSLITGAMFLNMSFFLAEVSSLKITDKGLIENIAKLVSNSGMEEERDGESPSDSSAKEVDLLSLEAQIHYQLLFSTTLKACQIWDNLYLHANYSLRFTPPPDTTSLLEC